MRVRNSSLLSGHEFLFAKVYIYHKYMYLTSGWVFRFLFLEEVGSLLGRIFTSPT